MDALGLKQVDLGGWSMGAQSRSTSPPGIRSGCGG